MAAEQAHGAQIVNVTDTHAYVLDERQLDSLLLDDNIKDLPVVVVSVAGAFRSGKSFLLNFFLRYLKSPQSARDDGSWLGENSQSLEGFKWRNGIVRTTTGILMWSEPFISTLPNGDKVAILIMDMQGTFDSTSTVRECSTIFALSTLLSSVQIYNLPQDIQEDDLQRLQQVGRVLVPAGLGNKFRDLLYVQTAFLFTAYGEMVKSEDSKAFQVLEFLVRDWQFPEEYPYGAAGGETLLQQKLQITSNLPKEMQDLRRHLHSTFERVSCFLMPHPGFKVLKKTFTGKISDIEEEFRNQVIDLAKSLFSPDKLLPKKINGQIIKARDLKNYFKTYMALFNSDEIPSPTSIMKATVVEVGLLSILNESREVYERGMDADCGPNQPSEPLEDLKMRHALRVSEACAFFTNKKKMGTEEDHKKYFDKLRKELEERLPQFVQSNLAKIPQAINKAKEAYEDAVQLISKDKPLCVHLSDVIEVHEAGVTAAIDTFNKARRGFYKKPDDERNKLIQSFEKRYPLLRLTNEQNNKMATSVLTMEYWKYMQTKCALDPPLSDIEFKAAHEQARETALQSLESKRNIHSRYTEDIFKFILASSVNENFIQLKALNKSTNKVAVEAAIKEYDNYMNYLLNTDKCLNPRTLEREHQNGLCRALFKLRPNKHCYVGFDSSDKDEMLLKEILTKRYKDTKSINESANETALQEAYNVYVTTMVDLRWLVLTGVVRSLTKDIAKNHETAKAKGREVFYSKRHEETRETSDSFMKRLDQMMDSYYSKNY